MIRPVAVLLLLIVGGCADQSKGAALNECRTRYDIRPSADRGHIIQECMQAKSFQFTLPCSPIADEHDWDWKAKTFAYDNPQCYRPVGSQRWIATALTPM
jgi:hypothetical protein